MDDADFEKRQVDAFDRQREVLDSIKERKGERYARMVALTASTMSALWAAKKEMRMEDVDDLLDHAAECVLWQGMMRAMPSPDDGETAKKLLDEFTAGVHSVARHQVLEVDD